MELKSSTIAGAISTCWFEPGTSRGNDTANKCSGAAKKVSVIDPNFTCKWTKDAGNILRNGNDGNIYLGATVSKPSASNHCSFFLKKNEATDVSKVDGVRVYPGLKITGRRKS
jgi:hypothetical protein